MTGSRSVGAHRRAPLFRTLASLVAAASVLAFATSALVIGGAASPARALVAVEFGSEHAADAEPGWVSVTAEPEPGFAAVIGWLEPEGGDAAYGTGDDLDTCDFTAEGDGFRCELAGIAPGSFELFVISSSDGATADGPDQTDSAFTVKPALDSVVYVDQGDGGAVITGTRSDGLEDTLVVVSSSYGDICQSDPAIDEYSCSTGELGLGTHELIAYTLGSDGHASAPTTFTIELVDPPSGIGALPDAELRPAGPEPGRLPGWAMAFGNADEGATMVGRAWLGGEIGVGTSYDCVTAPSEDDYFDQQCLFESLPGGYYVAQLWQTDGLTSTPAPERTTTTFTVLSAVPETTVEVIGSSARFVVEEPQIYQDYLAITDDGEVLCTLFVLETAQCDSGILDPGDYTAYVYTSDMTQDFGGDIGTPLEFTILPAPTADLRLSFTPSAVQAVIRSTFEDPYGVRLYTLSEGDEGYRYCEAHPSGSPSAVRCGFPGLEPGDYLLDVRRYEGEGSHDYTSRSFTVPERPAVSSALRSYDGVTTVRGTVSGSARSVLVVSGSTAVCQAAVAADGAWSCTSSSLAEGASLRAYAAHSTGGLSALSSGATVAAAPLTPAQEWQFSVTGLAPDGTVIPGQEINLSGTGLPAGSTVGAEIHSTPRTLGSTVVNPTGAFQLDVLVPDDIEPGEHTFVLTLTAPGAMPSIARQPVTVAPPPVVPVVPAAPVESQPLTTDVEIESEFVPASFSGPNRDDPANRTILTNSLVTVGYLVAHPETFAFAALVALALLLLVAFPTTLLDSTLESNSHRITPVIQRVRHALTAALEWIAKVSRLPFLAPAVMLLLASLAFGFADPGLGLDLTSLRTVLSLFIALSLLTMGSAAITRMIARWRWGADATISMEPLGLLATIGGVIAGRLLDFSPGFFLGILVGLDLLLSDKDPRRVRVQYVHNLVILGLAVAGWLVYSVLFAGAVPTDFVTGTLHDASVSLTAEGLTLLITGLLPFTFLAGKELFDHSRARWAALYLTCAGAFGLLVLPTSVLGADTAGDLVRLGLILVGFAALVITIWAAYRSVHRRHELERAAGTRAPVATDADEGIRVAEDA